MKRLVCLLVGHRRGDELFRYATTGDTQRPDSRTKAIVTAGYVCARCGAKVLEA